ncbi:MAG: tetratricopeptide repeat protein [Nitrospirae bacterium]|nr:tetratricopeptide repeat protein [Nitrospirota bacterium]
MPKIIKKRPDKKKAAQEPEVKTAALHALKAVKKRQRQVIIIVSVIAAVAVLIAAFMFYSSSQSKKAYALETEAYNIYYGADKTMPEQERWKKALELYQKAVHIKATPTALFYLGNCHYNLADYENAVKQYSLFVDKFGNASGISPIVYQKLASAYFKTGKNDKALETLGKLAKVNSGIFKDTALLMEARHYESAGDAAKAQEKYKALVTEFPNSPWGAEANAKLAAKSAQGAQTEKEDKGAAEPKPPVDEPAKK